MQRIVLKYGLIGAVVFAVLMPIGINLVDSTDSAVGEVFGYASMVVAFLMIYFGVRSYRDTVTRGTLRFWRAFQVGVLIALVACAGYVATWEVMYYKFMPDFQDKYAAATIAKAKARGVSAEELAATTAQMEKFATMYKNPFINMGMTFMEAFPVGLVFALVTAGVLRTRGQSNDLGQRARGATSLG